MDVSQKAALTYRIFQRMGFSISNQGPYVYELYKTIEKQVEKGLINRSAGTWAPEHGRAGMRLDPEERARAFLEMDWEIANGYTCLMNCIDRPFGWKYYLNKDTKAWTKRYEIRWKYIPSWLGDRFRSYGLSWKSFFYKKVLGRTNPYRRVK